MIEVDIDKDVYLPCFQHLIGENDIDIELIWGGRDSGKSKFVSQLLTEESMTLDYFRCLLIKETHESIKDAQWQMLKDTAEQWGVDSLFKFQSSPLGAKCVNGSTFHARGMDNPAKIRSFSNPSHAWVEEGNQISEDAFVTIITGLRSDYGKVKLYFTFNPEANCPDFNEYWLYKTFFKNHEPLKSFIGFIEMKVIVKGKEEIIRLKYRSTHVTYNDNPYVTPQRIAFHESIKTSNPYWYRVFTLGFWGNIANDSPWAFAFNRNKHVSDGVRIQHPVLNRNNQVFLSWDFNRNPMTCLVMQDYGGTLYVLECIRLPKSGVDEMCEYIKVKYPGILFIITGDYNGNNESSLFHEQITHYKLIKHYLSLSDNQLKVKPNPRQAKNSTHINTVLAWYNIVIHGTDAAALVFDLENVKRRADGTIAKTDRDDAAQQADALDCFRYYCNAFLDWFKPDASQMKPVKQDAIIVTEQKKIKYANPQTGDVASVALYAIERGDLVLCTAVEYHQSVRTAILKQAGKYLEHADSVHAQIALAEVKRLDAHFKKA